MFRKSCAVMTAVLLFAALALSVSAAEVPDWETVDWETAKLDTLFRDSAVYSDFREWLEQEASFSELFEYSKRTDGAFTTDFHWIAYKRFIAQPEKFLIALAKEDEKTQQHIVFGIAFDAEIRDKDTTVKTIEGIRLSKEQTPRAVELMLDLIDEMEEHLQVTITVPQTGDSVMAAAVALLLSGVGWIAVKEKK